MDLVTSATRTPVSTGPAILILLLSVAGADSWRWGSVSTCPPGPEPECPKNPVEDASNYFPHPTDCHYYIQCDGSGKPICRRCSPTTYFNPITFNCVWPIQASCEHNATTRQDSLLPPICGPDRDGCVEGIKEPDYVSCSRYYTCTNNTKVKLECPDVQAFNKELLVCDNTLECDGNIIIPTPRCKVEGQVTKIDCRKYKVCKEGYDKQHTCNSNQYFDEASASCKVGPCERKPCEDKEDPTDCRYYMKNCNQRTQCPPEQHFNKRTKVCEHKCTAGCQDPNKIQGCWECQNEKEILEYDCQSYKICTGRTIVLITCRQDQHFDISAGVCIPGPCKPCEDKEDPTDCRYYIKNCNQRTQCPPEQHFNKRTKVCEHKCTAGCQDPNIIQGCWECQNEKEILEYDCQSYKICTGRKIVVITCRQDQHFDISAGVCIPGPCKPCEDKEDPTDCRYYIKNCNQRTQCPPEQHFNKRTKVCEHKCTAGCQDKNIIQGCWECQNEKEILEYDCQSYKICTGSKIVVITCRQDQHFDISAGVCRPGPCKPCEDKEDPTDCRYYIKNCNQRTQCPPEQHFNKRTKVCEHKCTAGCNDPNIIQGCWECQNEKEILKYDCQSYKICTGRKIVVITCRQDQHFDISAGVCIPGPCKPCEDKEDPTDCRYYIKNCNQRTQCPPEQHFNKRTKVCEHKCTAGCQDPNIIQGCWECQNEKEILEYDCQSYKICTGRKIVVITCRQDQHFDISAGVCIPGPCKPCEDKEDPTDCRYYIKNCNQRTQCPPEQHFNKRTKVCEHKCTAGCQDPNIIQGCWECQNEKEILEYDCQSYKICTGRKIVLITCRQDQHFDKSAGVCIPGPCKPCEDKEDPTDCRYYIKNCNQRTQCPPEQHFNKRTKVCEHKCTAGCNDPNIIQGCWECQNEKEILKYDCQSYKICTGRKIVVITCRQDQHFDISAGVCIPGPCKPCEDKEDPTDCRYYIKNCNQRTQCPPEQHFNKRTKVCEHKCTAGCQDPNIIQGCWECQNEKEILEYDCQSYKICTGRKIVVITCRQDQHFDISAGVCIPGPCKPCEDKEDPTDCRYYIKNCNQRTQCPPEQHFNKRTKVCEHKCTAGCQDPNIIQGCWECQNEKEILEYDCQSYKICTGRKIVLITCRQDQHFDKSAGVCIPGPCKPCEDKEDPTDCRYYIKNCNQRTQCPPEQHFNKRTKVCEHKCTAGCQDPNIIQGCWECQNEKEILEYDCQSYKICTGRKIVLITCRQDQHFDKSAGVCIPGPCKPCEDKEDPTDCRYYIKNCNQRTQCPPEQHFNKRTKVCEHKCTAGCQDPNIIQGCWECQNEKEILEYDCQSYKICTGRKIVLITCRQDQHFDKSAGVCIPGPCKPCEDKEDPTDCRYYIKNCNQRTQCPPEQHFNKRTKVCEHKCTAGCQDPNIIQGCWECQNEKEILEYDCQSYKICTGRKIVLITCRQDQHFDKSAGVCIPGPCKPCEDKEDPTDCRYYIKNCNQRTQCPPEQHFNKRTKVCEHKCTAGCQDPNIIQGCWECQNEKEILEYDCQSYKICTGRKIVLITCRQDQHFDKSAGVCIPGPCKPCEDKEDPTDCRYYIKNCNQRTQCPPEQHFNKRTKVCEHKCTAGCQDPNIIQGCWECQNEKEILEYDCQSYKICTGRKIVLITCRQDQHFDKSAGVCIPGPCKPCEDKEDPTDCRYYIKNCNQRTQCPPEQHFNKRTKVCEHKCTAGCQDPNIIQGCWECQNEKEILEYDCQSYKICTGRKIVLITCRQDQHFDKSAGVCRPGPCKAPCVEKEDPTDCNYYFKDCDKRTRCPKGQHFSKKTRTCVDQCIAGCVDPSTIIECHICKPEGQTFEDPCSCEMYYKCVNGSKVLAMCGNGLHYNATRGRCDTPCSDTCSKLFARKPECCASTKGKPEPQCPNTKYSVFIPHPSDSHWFYQCLQSVLYCNRCPPGFRWNIDEDTCDDSCQCP